jgi:hypothetical protein
MPSAVLYNKELYNENNPALFIAHGTDDPTVFLSKSERFRGGL